MFQNIPSYETRYEISPQGEIYSKGGVRVRSDGVARSFKRRKLSQRANENGYMIVSLWGEQGTHSFKVHRLVLSTFNPVSGWESLDVNHKDGIKSNNDLSNLEWCTRSENLYHKHRVLGHVGPSKGKFGHEHHRSIKVFCAKNGAVIKEYDSLMCAQRDGFSAGHISSCLSGKRQKHKGLTWHYL